MDSMAARQSHVSASNVIANTDCSPVWDLVERNHVMQAAKQRRPFVYISNIANIS